ncbi:glycerol ethanol, ferric requiring protein [Savitreella phatthalungensis]
MEDGLVRPTRTERASSFQSLYSVNSIGEEVVDEIGRSNYPEDGMRHRENAGGAARFRELETDDVKRYEEFHTIDWIQDAVADYRRKERQLERRDEDADAEQQSVRPLPVTASRSTSTRLRVKTLDLLDAGQTWIAVTLAGVVIGLNAAVLSILTEFLGDVKHGYCRRSWYLNKAFCCWGEAEGAVCSDWTPWSHYFIFNYLFYIGFAALFSAAAALIVREYAPYAAGSGISEIKCIIGGFVMRGFLSLRTLAIKSMGLPLAIASGLSVGKEGPSVHVAVCAGNVVARFFDKYVRHAARMREIYIATSAAGVGVAFGSPIGGVLFALEEMSSSYGLRTMLRSFFCALVATSVLAAVNPFRTGQLVMFEVTYDRDWHFFEIIFFAVLGVFGGVYGEFVMKWNMAVAAFRRKHLKQYGLQEAVTLAVLTAIIAYWNPFLRLDMTKSMELLFKECDHDDNYAGLCSPGGSKTLLIMSLLLATILRTLLVIISYGCKVPAGIFVPSMAIGATFGRAIGTLVAALHERHPTWAVFATCKPDVPCITPGTYAFLGAAAALSGIMHITISVVVIMFELTGALTFILPTMIVVGITKVVSEYVGSEEGGVADRMIRFNGFPFLDNKEDPLFGIKAAAIMVRRLMTIPATGLTVGAIEDLLAKHAYTSFPVVYDHEACEVYGLIGRRELQAALRTARSLTSVSPTTQCVFVDGQAEIRQSQPQPAVTSDEQVESNELLSPETPDVANFEADRETARTLNLSPWVDRSFLAIYPETPLETATELFKTLGPRVILVARAGRLRGLLTVKDILKYERYYHHHHHHQHDRTDDDHHVTSARPSFETFEHAALGGYEMVRSLAVQGVARYTTSVRRAFNR